jgi:hypothetical protein
MGASGLVAFVLSVQAIWNHRKRAKANVEPVSR